MMKILYLGPDWQTFPESEFQVHKPNLNSSFGENSISTFFDFLEPQSEIKLEKNKEEKMTLIIDKDKEKGRGIGKKEKSRNNGLKNLVDKKNGFNIDGNIEMNNVTGNAVEKMTEKKEEKGKLERKLLRL